MHAKLEMRSYESPDNHKTERKAVRGAEHDERLGGLKPPQKCSVRMKKGPYEVFLHISNQDERVTV